MESWLLDDSFHNPYKKAIRYILRKLPTEERNTLLLWHLCGHNIARMSEELNISKPYLLKELKTIKDKIKESTLPKKRKKTHL